MLSHLQAVEIEIQSTCNRSCPWCFNAKNPRSYREMPEGLFLKILKELKQENFGKVPEKYTNNKNRRCLILDRNNEPMLNMDLLNKRLKQVNELKGKGVTFGFRTNGDFLSRETLENIEYTNRIIVNDYDRKGKEFWIEMFEAFGIILTKVKDNSLEGFHKKINLIKVQLDWGTKNIQIDDRGGYLKDDIYWLGEKIKWKNNKEKRTEKCLEPKFHLSIDVDGNIMPCSRMRADIPQHKEYILGNIKDNTIVEIMNGDKAVKFREKVYEKGEFPEICKTCSKQRKSFNWDAVKDCPSLYRK